MQKSLAQKSLAEKLNEKLEISIETEKKPFAIENKEQAVWAMRKLAQLEKEITDAKQLAEKEINKIKEWFHEETEKLGKQADFFRNLLINFHERELEINPKSKTIRLPYGDLVCRAQEPLIKKEEKVLKKWVKENRPEFLVPQEPKLDWAGLKKVIKIAGDKAVTEDGELVPGIEAVEREPKFTVKVKL